MILIKSPILLHPLVYMGLNLGDIVNTFIVSFLMSMYNISIISVLVHNDSKIVVRGLVLSGSAALPWCLF